MNNDSTNIDIERLLKIIRRRAGVIVLCAVITGAASFGLSKRQTREYTATASVLFQSPQINQQAAGVQVISNSDQARLTATQVQLAALGSAANATASLIGHGLTAQAVRGALSVSEQGQTDIGLISATYRDPVLAAAIANTFTQQFIAQRRAADQGNVRQALTLLNQQIARLSPIQRASSQGQALTNRAEALQVLTTLQTGDAQIAQAAGVPSSPSSPRVSRNTVIGIMLGLLLGFLVAFGIDRFDRTIKDIDALEAAFGLPLIGSVPDSAAYQRGVLEQAGTDGQALSHGEAEVFRMLRAHLRYFNVDREMKIVLVTSHSSGDGKTTVATHLADAAAGMGTRVLLVEADLRRPTIAQTLGLASAPGVADALVSLTDFQGATQVVSQQGRNGTGPGTADRDDRRMHVMVAGAMAPNPAELLESHAMTDLLEWAAAEYELVVIDTPPLTVVADAIPLLTKVSGVLIVSRLGRTTRDGAQDVRKRLESIGAPVLGVVANGFKAQRGYGYDGYGGYYGNRKSSSGVRDGSVPERSTTS